MNQTQINHSPELLHDNRRLMQNLFKVQEEERRLLSRELHDELGQWLTAIYAESEIISRQTSQDSSLYASSQAINECVQEIHKVIHGMLRQLRPVLLDTLGLADALYELKKHWSSYHPHVSFDFKLIGNLDKLSESTNITIFRIVQEALNNICSHAEATQAKVCLSYEAGKTPATDYLSLWVEDNGKGYEVDQVSNGLGLLGMRERTIAAGGEFAVYSAPNDGTQIQVKLPLNPLSTNPNRRHDDH